MPPTPNPKLRILFLEDDANDFALVKQCLAVGGLPCDLIRVESHRQFLDQISHTPDVILSDHHLPEFDGFAALELARENCPHVPFLFVSGSVNQAGKADTLRKGVANIIPKEDIAQSLVAAICSARDMSNQNQLEELQRENAQLKERLDKSNAELAAALQELDSFSYSVSHDLRAPLRHIDGFADLLRNNPGEQSTREYLDIITNSAREMGRLIEAILAFSRLGRIPLARSLVNLRTLVDSVIHDVAYETENRRVHWHIGPLPEVMGDPKLLRQAVLNLISNALKFTRPMAEAKLEISSTIDGNEVIVHVRDNGVGFDMQFADKLFGVFQRLHPASQFEGLGTGLANARRIIQRHGGRTWAEAAPDQGATFYFSLPSNQPIEAP